MPASKQLLNKPDAELVQLCLDGSQPAWTVLIERYSKLIYSVIASYRLPPQDAADVFQTVCVELYSGLARLREVTSLRRWLITVASHESHRSKAKTAPSGEAEEAEALPSHELPDADLLQLERAHILRQAIDQLPPRCAEMIRLLFYSDPPLPYAEVAARLGLAAGSIGFIRARCLNKLRENLERLGF